MIIPRKLAASCGESADRGAWLERLPRVILDLQERWSLTIGAPFDGDDVSCAWVATVHRNDGTRAVLELGMPHMEGRDEIRGLRFWNGDPTVRLLEADDDANAMLLERCEPGHSLRQRGEPEQTQWTTETMESAERVRLWMFARSATTHHSS